MKKVLLALCAALALVACGESTTSAPVIGADGQPTGQTVQQSSGGMSATTGALLGGLAGYMMGRSSATPAPSYGGGTTIIQRRTVINTAPQSTFQKPPSTSSTFRPAPTFSKPSTPSFSRPSSGFSRPSSSFSRGRR